MTVPRCQSYLKLLQCRASFLTLNRRVARVLTRQSELGRLGYDPCAGIHVDPEKLSKLHSDTPRRTYRSMQVPGNLDPTRFAKNPRLSKPEMYHGVSPAERSRTLPPIFRA